MLEWIPAFFEKATAFVPRFEKVPPTYRMVKWSGCREATLHGPGRIWYWPLITEHETCDIRFNSTVTCVQAVTMADGTTVSARTLTRWRVKDVVNAVQTNADYNDAVPESAQGVLVDVLGCMTKDQLRHVAALSTSLTMSVRDELEPMGIEVEKCKFTELCVSPAFRIINDA